MMVCKDFMLPMMTQIAGWSERRCIDELWNDWSAALRFMSCMQQKPLEVLIQLIPGWWVVCVVKGVTVWRQKAVSVIGLWSMVVAAVAVQ